jgi:intein/homing endonuclease
LSFEKATLSSTLDLFASAYKAGTSGFTDASYSEAMGGDNSVSYVAKQNWQTQFSGAQLAARLDINQRGRDIIRTAVDVARLEQVGSKLALVIDFNISFKEAEFLSQSPVQEISLANLYSFLMLWVGSNFASVPGSSVAPYSVPITKIAERVTLELKDPSKKLTKRTDADSLLVDHLGSILYIPDVDNTQAYVQKLSAFGTQPDGSFSYKSVLAAPSDSGETNFKLNDPASQRKKLPANIPLFTDWVNRKFAYVNSSGNVDVLDLGTCTPLSAYNIKTMLSIAVGGENPVSPVGYVLFIAEATQPGFMKSSPPTSQEMDPAVWSKLQDKLTAPGFLNDLTNMVGRVRAATNKDTSLLSGGPEKWEVSLDAFNRDSPISEFRFVGRLVDEAKTLLLDNLETVFTKYSVTTVLTAIASAFVFSKYADKYTQVVEADKASREDYLTQGVDESYVAPPIPNFRKEAAFLPHQAKADNKLRRGPRFAIIEVDAGGGKTLQILTNILRTLHAKQCVKPIIVCPSHLISSYVKEAVYFTEGKINIVPLTNIALKQHGEERLSDIVNKAPINTIFLTDFNFIKNKGIDVAYGNTQITVYRNAEFLRKFEFDLICVDECHYLRAQSLRTKAAASFMTEIPMKRLASGTFIADTIADVAPQFALLDPTVFGTREQFIKTYAAEMRGEKVMAWKPGAEAMIRTKMAEHCVMVNHKRKEWAALLPMPQEEFFGVELTDNQRALYETILQQTLDLLREAIANDPELKEALESNDDSKAELLQLKLHRYLARLEAFLSSPESDVAGKEFLLLPEDQISPKVKKIYERIRYHTENKIPGKILIFTNYLRAAQSVYDNAPPDIKKRMIHYTAETKAECKTAFETLPEKDIMVGVETSMNTGLNLQFCSRLIRMETVWTPGVLEQGNARVNRPNVKKKETRQFIYFDWIVINKCVVGETLIPTELGLRRISSLGTAASRKSEVLDLKVGSRTKPQRTLRWWNNGVADTLKITTKAGREVQGTPNHGLLVLREGEHVWVHLEDLVKGDLLCSNLGKMTRKTPLKLDLVMPEYTHKSFDEERREKVYAHLYKETHVTTKSIEEASGYSNWQSIGLAKKLVQEGYLNEVTAKAGRRPAVYEKTEAFNSDCLKLETPISAVSKIPSRMTTDLAYALGLLVAEGCVFSQNGSVENNSVALGMLNREPVEFIADVIEKTFGVNTNLKSWDIDPNRNKVRGQVVYEDRAYYMQVLSPTLVSVLDQLGLHTQKRIKGRAPAWDKTIPWSILEADEESQLAFLAGFWEGDGSQSRGELHFCTVSKALRHELQILLTSHGVRTRNHSAVTVLATDAPKLWERMLSYVKGPKAFRPAGADTTGCNFGVPAKFWTDLLTSRLKGRYRVGHEGGDRWIYTSDSGKDTEATFEENHIGLRFATDLKLFRYAEYAAGAYDRVLGLLKRISPRSHSLLIDALKTRYDYDSVVSIRKGGAKQVFDLSMSNGCDGKEPSYIVNGLVGHNTIDVSKISRLISKMVSKAKFDEWENPAYQAIPDVPQIAMTMDTIAAFNDFEGSLLPYLETYEKYKQVQMADYKDYKARNQGKLDPVPIAAEGILPGSKLMTRVPYVPDMEVYGENDLGLIRYDQFIHQDAASLDEDDDESDADTDDAEDPKNAALQEERAVMKGQPVHTEWGDGVITGIGKKRIRVMLSDGTRKPVNKLAAYVITRSSTNSKDMRAELLKTVGQLPLTEPFDVPVEEGPANKKRRGGKPQIVEQEEVETPSASFDITVVNDYLALSYRTLGQGDKMVSRLANLGFVQSPAYYYSVLIGPRNLIELFKEWKAAGFKIDPKTSLTFQHIHQALKGDKKAGNRFGFATEMSLKNWLRSTVKPTADPKVIHPYPIVQDEQLYIALPIQGQAGTRAAIKFQPLKIRWKIGGEDEVLRFVTNTPEIIQVLKQVQAEGIKIDNLDELKEQYSQFKMIKPRSDV